MTTFLLKNMYDGTKNCSYHLIRKQQIGTELHGTIINISNKNVNTLKFYITESKERTEVKLTSLTEGR